MSGTGNKVLNVVLILAAPFVVASIIATFLGTKTGKSFAEKLGNPELATMEGRAVVKKYTQGFTGLALTTFARMKSKDDRAAAKELGWSYLTSDVAELCLATGALLKVVSSFLEEHAELKRAQGRLAGA